MRNKPTIEENIDKCMAKGLPDEAIRAMLFELWQSEIIRFEDVENPYWESSGELLDSGEEIIFD
jgi:hypothetical protein